MTPARQAELIAKHCAFYLALYKGERAPTNSAQKRFIKNIRSGQSTDEHELAFLNWLVNNPKFKNKKATEEHSNADQDSFNCLRKNTPLSKADLLFCKELYDGFRMPETAEQDSFARNVQKGVATNDHERAFLKWLNIAPKPTPKPTPTPTPKPSPPSNRNFERKHTQPAYKGTTKAKWKQGWRTPDDMQGGFSPSKTKIIKTGSSGPQKKDPDKPDYDKLATGKAHGDPARRRIERGKDRYGRKADD
jgi:uncharacterized protein YifE (UPF0438 family)